MIELRIIIPAEPPRGNHDALEFKLIVAFGGYTVTKGNGAWTPPGPSTAGESPVVYEPVLIYDVAGLGGRPGCRGYHALRRIARWAAGEFGQTSIYLRGPGGVVEFIKPADPLSDPNSFKGPDAPKRTVPTRSEAAERAEAEAEFGPTPEIDALADARAAKDARERAGFI